MAYLEKLISTKGAIDSLCLKETIVRSMVGQISNNVRYVRDVVRD